MIWVESIEPGMIPDWLAELCLILFPVVMYLLYIVPRDVAATLDGLSRLFIFYISLLIAEKTHTLRSFTFAFVMFEAGDHTVGYPCTRRILEVVLGRDRLNTYVHNVTSLINLTKRNFPDIVKMITSYLHFIFVTIYMFLILAGVINGLRSIGIIVHAERISPIVYIILAVLVFTNDNYKVLFYLAYNFFVYEIMIPLALMPFLPSIRNYVENTLNEYNWGVIHIP